MQGMALLLHKVMWLQRVRTIAFVLLGLLVAVMIGGLVMADPAHAATFTVNSANDRGDEVAGNGECYTGVLIADPTDGLGTVPECTLRAAIQEANVNGQSDTINSLSGLNGTITLSLGELVIANDNPDTNDLIIEGPGVSKLTVSGNEASRVFKISEFAHTAISGLTISKGRPSNGYGGGIFNDSGATLTLTDTTVSGNTASLVGGGIYSESGLTLIGSTVSGNAADGDFGGGGILSTGFLQVFRTTVSGNTAQVGGGISTFDYAKVINSTVSGNSADFGGGIFNREGQLRATDTTVSSNTATYEGGGIANNAKTELRNTIIARNSAPDGPDAKGTFDSQGRNLIGNISGSVGWRPSDLLKVNPLLGPLQNNGGPTETHALKKGSPAINTIPRATNGCGTEITNDQRGLKRPQGKKCDIGSFEKKQKRRR